MHISIPLYINNEYICARMNNTLVNVDCQGDGVKSSSVGVTTDGPLNVQCQNQPWIEASHNGVSTLNVPQWYVLRTTYGQEKKAFDYIIAHGGEAFYPTLQVLRKVNGIEKTVTVSRIPNLFFMRGTFEQVRSFVEEDPKLPFLRFYSHRSVIDHRVVYTPIIVPESQMRSLQLLCGIVDENIMMVPPSVTKFESGQPVRIIAGEFQGIEGHVARWHGQQRVAVIIPGLLTMATAYVPTNFLENI